MEALARKHSLLVLLHHTHTQQSPTYTHKRTQAPKSARMHTEPTQNTMMNVWKDAAKTHKHARSQGREG